METEVILSDAVPVFFTVTVWAALETPTTVLLKVSDVGLRLTAGAAGAVAVPERATVWGEPVMLSAKASDAVRVPVAVGLKVTEAVHFAPTATLLPQVLAWL